jgi:hypothetical protein
VGGRQARSAFTSREAVDVGELINIETVKREERIREKTTTIRVFDVFMLNHTSGPWA